MLRIFASVSVRLAPSTSPPASLLASELGGRAQEGWLQRGPRLPTLRSAAAAAATRLHRALTVEDLSHVE
ncbi:hypothetical protein Taro_009439 [Colocasia esculenta]|uniref:Uncharacterized protein n=1 Tax=Colocasia esculenta TaxID=4460 RepID=A0A843U5S2_COLES|nr:hypothetical protein [Colocasia esculenta]